MTIGTYATPVAAQAVNATAPANSGMQPALSCSCIGKAANLTVPGANIAAPVVAWNLLAGT